tara:strand:- start:271 stop:564 length:294 start_codon:yes stop_codon:yes gene_type:complete
MKKKIVLGIIFFIVAIFFLSISYVFLYSLVYGDQNYTDICYVSSDMPMDKEHKLSDCLKKSQEIESSSKALSLLIILITLTSGISFLIKGIKFIKKT